jgi:CRP-like cAMP-binding protein
MTPDIPAFPADSQVGRLLALLPHAQVLRRSFPRGSTILGQGDPAKAIYLVEAGRVRLARNLADGTQLIRHVAHPGKSFANAALSAMDFGAVLSLVPLAIGVGLLGAAVTDAGSLALEILLGAMAFTALGVLMAALATDTPSQVMVLSSLIRLPLIFISGVFVPLADLPASSVRQAMG